ESGFYTNVATRRLNERHVYYEHTRRRKDPQKSKDNEKASDSQQSDQMSVDENMDDQLDDTYVPGAY
ncbi:unnamed protein product, partial [Rotaria magnacalcarata]